MTTISVEIGMSVTTCPTCGMQFGVPPKWLDTKRRDHADFVCPNGHGITFKTTKTAAEIEVERLRDALLQQKRSREWAEADREAARQDRDAYKRKLVSAKGQLTRTKRRVGNGTCPCCGLGFPDLRAHMEQQHPDYKQHHAPAPDGAAGKQN